MLRERARRYAGGQTGACAYGPNQFRCSLSLSSVLARSVLCCCCCSNAPNLRRLLPSRTSCAVCLSCPLARAIYVGPVCACRSVIAVSRSIVSRLVTCSPRNHTHCWCCFLLTTRNPPPPTRPRSRSSTRPTSSQPPPPAAVLSLLVRPPSRCASRPRSGLAHRLPRPRRHYHTTSHSSNLRRSYPASSRSPSLPDVGAASPSSARLVPRLPPLRLDPLSVVDTIAARGSLFGRGSVVPSSLRA